jgi:cell division protein FtsW
VIGLKAKDRFGALLTMGIVFQVGLQTALNIGVVTDTLPNTGISLPFFSYGGNSLLMLLAEMGMVLSVSRSSSLTKQ